MAAQTIDYDALAKQNGAVSSAPPAVDYDALAKANGATGALPAKLPGDDFGQYVRDTVSNIPSSAARFAGNVGNAMLHPIDTAGNLLKVATGTAQKMTPGYVTPERPGYSKEAEAAGNALKDRYGSIDAIKDTIKNDPVGVASDVSAVAGGVSGLARGASAVADLANLPRVANAASDVSRGAATVSNVTNPLTLPMKAAGATSKAIGKGLVKSALKLPGRTERYGATPATAALEKTSGITPSAVRASAEARLADLNAELESLASLAKASGNTGDLTTARQVVADEIAKVKAANGLADDLVPMQTQLTEARPGFTGAVTPTGEVAAQQDPMTFLGMKRQFGNDFTKFDAAVPLKDSARKVGNKAYHEMADEFNRAVPGARPINQEMQSLVPVKEGAQRAQEGAGAVQRAIDRGTRPTGGLAAILFALHEKGYFGGMAVAMAQEIMSSPTAKMAAARALYGGGKVVGDPTVRNLLNQGAAIDANSPDFGKLPRFAKGGVIRRPMILVDAQTGKPAGTMAERGSEAIVPLAHPPKLDTPGTERRLIHSLMYRASESGVRPPKLETPRLMRRLRT